MLKKIIKFTAFTLLILVVAAIAIPFLFKGKILAIVKEKANKSMNAKVDFSDVDISVFRHFPKLAVGINNLFIVGVNEFEGDSLMSAKQLDLSMNLWSAITGGEIDIYTIDIETPRINTIINNQGQANWDIAKPDSSASTNTTESKPVKLKLNHYAFHNGFVKYSDNMGNIFATIDGIEHSGSGDFAADIFTLVTKTNIEKWSYAMDGVTYINNAKTNADIDLQIDSKAMKFSFNTDKIALNDLKLSTNGFFQIVNDSTYGMDINFKAPSTDFKSLLSLIPTIYQNNFSTIKTSGEAVFNGFVKGNYNNTTIPAYQLNLQINNGFFQYPDLPAAVKDINVSMKIDNPDGITDHTVVDITKAHLSLANESFDFRLLVKNPISDLFVDAAAKGKLDLSKIAQFVKITTITKLQGLLTADIAVKGSTLAMQKKEFDKFTSNGIFNLTDFVFASNDYPSGVSLSNVLMTFNPKNVVVNNLGGRFMNTNFSANGYVNNLLPYVFKNQPLDGVVNVKANNINLNELMGVSTDSTQKNTPQSKPFIVPKNLNLTINTAVDKVHYDKLDLANVSGSLLIADETVRMNNVKADALNGQLGVSGYYSTKLDTKKPDIALTYNVANVDIQKTFYAFNTMEKIMPIGKFLAGKLTSAFTMTGKLGENMMPDLASLTGNGNFLMLEGVLSKFLPVDKLAQTLNITEFKQIALKEVKSAFEFTNGKVSVKPFNVKVAGIDMEIGGTHSFEQLIDYTLNMKIPRAMMGVAGNNLINNLIAQAATKGLPVKVSDIVNIQAKVGGSIKAPTIKTDLKQTANSLAQDLKQQATAFIQNKIDSTKAAVTAAIKDTIKAVKQEVINDVKNQIIKQIFKTGDTTQTAEPKKKVEEAGKNILKNLNPFKKD
jgi:hypothetical protein